MNVAYALIPEKCMLPVTKYHRLSEYIVCLPYILTRDLRNDSSATNMLYVLKYKRREFYDGSVLLLLSITMLQQSQFVFEFHRSMMNAAILLFFFLFGQMFWIEFLYPVPDSDDVTSIYLQRLYSFRCSSKAQAKKIQV
jgi:hypothetical protein